MTGAPEILVQKFGGTSVATTSDLRRVAGIVSQARQSASSIVIVVSARGSTTSELIALANSVSADPPARELDQLLATGEIASAALLAIALAELGIPAVSLDGRQAGISVRGQHCQGILTRVHTERIRQHLADGKVVVVAGFQGINDKGDVMTLGRGGSDTTAMAISAALGQYQCDIYTDVDGIYSSDPRVVASARKLTAVSHAEGAELAFAGAKVLHHRAGGLALANNIDVRILSSFTPCQGTTITRDQGQIQAESDVIAVSLDPDVAKVTIDIAGQAEHLLAALGGDCGPIDVFAWERDRVIFTVRRELVRAVLRAAEIQPAVAVVITDDVAKASAIGRGLLNSTEYLARVVHALQAAGLPTDLLCAGQHRISVLVPSDHGVAATESLHAEFALDRVASP